VNLKQRNRFWLISCARIDSRIGANHTTSPGFRTYRES